MCIYCLPEGALSNNLWRVGWQAEHTYQIVDQSIRNQRSHSTPFHLSSLTPEDQYRGLAVEAVMGCPALLQPG
jgi:hypothetical protein